LVEGEAAGSAGESRVGGAGAKIKGDQRRIVGDLEVSVGEAESVLWRQIKTSSSASGADIGGVSHQRK
jgi:hypothetical protein